MRTSHIKIALFAITIFTLTYAYAAGFQYGTVQSTIGEDATIGTQSGQFAVTLSGATTTPAACNTLNQWGIRADTPGGKAMISQVIAAQIAGRSVGITGTGVCTIFSNREDVFYVVMN